MSKNWNVRRLLVCLLNGGLAGVLFLGSGCGFRPVIDTTRFYVLNLDDYEADSEGDSDSGSVVGMARLSVARYLDSPGIAVREGANRIMYSQSHRWAESLEYGVARLLVEALQREPAVKRVVAYPARPQPLPDYELHVTILRAEGVVGTKGPHAVFYASWELRAGDGEEVLASGYVQKDRLPWDGANFGQLAASLSDGTSTLAQEIASAVEELTQENGL